MKTVEKSFFKCQWGILFPFHHIWACVFNCEWKEVIKYTRTMVTIKIYYKWIETLKSKEFQFCFWTISELHLKHLTQSTTTWEIFTNLYEKCIDKLENKTRAKNYLIILIVFFLRFIISLGSLCWQKLGAHMHKYIHTSSPPPISIQFCLGSDWL